MTQFAPRPVLTAEKYSAKSYPRQRLLVIESTVALQRLISRTLAGQSFEIQIASNGFEGLALFAEQAPDLVVLGIDLPGLDGLELCRRIREYSMVPIMVILAPEQTSDGITAMNLGADDCLTWPFGGDELKAHTQALLRRTYWREQPGLPGVVQIGGLQINFQSRQLFRDGLLVDLSQTEWRLLELLVRHSGKVVTHEVLHRSAWGDTNYRESSNLRRYIHRLRNKLEDDPDNPRYLVSESGIGYRFLGQREAVAAPVDEAYKPSKRTAQLPIPPTSFIGWAGETERVKNLLQTPDVRLVSLIGPGGAGKTRLALQVASQMADHFEHGISFVPLAAIQEAHMVGAAIAQALGLKEEKSFPIEENLKAYLHTRRMLLVLDNFEQVMDAASLVAGLLETGSGLKILVTSRSVLHLYGEHEFELPPLTLPDLRQVSVDEISQSQAVALFVERARAMQADFNLTPKNALAVAELCVQLDGLPLAIELAAARTKLLSPQAITARLSDRFTLLADGAQNLPKRQQTMRNTLDWSYELLTLEEKVLFARMGVFKGGWTMDAVEVIAGIPFESAEFGRVNIDPLVQLPSLLDKSMVMRETGGDEMRFRMLETVHEYARERLESSGEVDMLCQRHINYYLRLAEAAQPKLESAQAQIWVECLEREHDNMRAALQWALGHDHQQETALLLATTLGSFWSSRGYLGEGRRWLEAALSYGSNNTPPETRARAFREAAWLALSQGDCNQAEKFVGMGQALWEALKDDPDVTCIMGLILDGQGKYEQACLLLQAALESYRILNDKKNIDFALHLLGQIAMKQADYDVAEAYLKEALAIKRQPLKSDLARSILTLAHISRLKGNYAQACKQYEECLVIFKEVGLAWGVAHCLLNLGKIASERRQFEEAQQLYLDTLKIFDELGDHSGLAYTLEAQANLAGMKRQTERAARLWGAAQALRKALSAPLPPADFIQFEEEVKNVRDYLAEAGYSDAEFMTSWRAGQAMSLEDAITFARQSE